jgi:hypothetical protein
MNNFPTSDEESDFASALRDKRVRVTMRALRDSMPEPQPKPVMPSQPVWRYMRIAIVMWGYAAIADLAGADLAVRIVFTVLGGIPAGVLVNQWYEEDRW